MWEDLDQFHNFGKFLAVFGTFLESFWSGIWQTFVPTLAIFMLPGEFSMIQTAKEWKILQPSGHTERDQVLMNHRAVSYK